ncbi:protein lin-54 homolog isoform X2 [Bicyclus anynana]|uniref:Protein lin-54 homolog isoform X2 n=1 Tax=Bicyclus anynana TaxID=110368 RepID=A0ABM3LW59_BICAN|nr:protein lin-54 homolog isoform X2 [Bicyclus anynana]
MDHNLDDSLNLDSDMGVDFEQPDDIVVTETGMSLEQVPHEEGISMEFEHTEEQTMLMDTSGEEIIDFMGDDQFTLQEYSVHSDQTTELTTTLESNQQQMLTTQSDTMIDIQFQPQIVSISSTDLPPPKLISVKAATPRPIIKKETLLASVPKQVAIAPKPPKLVTMKKYTPPKQLAIAPKPLNMPANRQSLVKKVSIANIVQATSKGNNVLAQLGKQLIMVPSGSQKIKIVSPGQVPNIQYIRADSDQAQLLAAKTVSGTQVKPLMTKVFTVQGKPSGDISNQPAVITKILPAGSSKPPRFVTVPPKAVPITFGNKVVMATPANQGLVKVANKQEIITIKSPTTKLLPAPTLVPVSSGQSKNKVIITNSTKNVILKPAPPPANALEVTKVSKVVIENQKSQLHQINVPGKGVQYVRIFTNNPPVVKPPPKPVALNAKTFVLTDDKAVAKPQHKLVRIAPVPKTTQVLTALRSAQSLLAPLSPLSPMHSTTTDSSSSLPESKQLEGLLEHSAGEEEEEEVEAEAEAEEEEDAEAETEEVDSKAALRQLIENPVSDDVHMSMNEVEIEYKQHHSSTEDNSIDSTEAQESVGTSEEQTPFIVVPSKFEQQPEDTMEEPEQLDESQGIDNSASVDDEAMNSTYQNASLSETDVMSSDFGLRPRKACNCTKSQCLKLYCDCFANGEFCNQCNCVNCHNNLENEELRQRAIRGCLDRNPNAFRPKIGKTKAGGPEIIRRHNKGCNCKRSGCLKNYCECYEAKIACTAICKCVGCRNVEETLERRHRNPPRLASAPPRARPSSPPAAQLVPKQPCSFMTTEVIEAVCQCLIAAAVETKDELEPREPDAMRDVIEEFARCLQDIIGAAHHSTPPTRLEEPA